MWIVANTDQVRNFSLALFVYFQTSSQRKQKFRNGSFLCFNLYWFEQVFFFEINFNTACRHSLGLLHVEGKLSFVMARIWVRLHGFCNKTSSFPSMHLVLREGRPSSSPQRTPTLPEWFFCDWSLNYAIQLLSKAWKGFGFPSLE